MTILFLVLIVWFLIEFEPFQMFIDWFFTYLPIGWVTSSIWFAFSCGKCLGFWLTLIVTFDLFSALLVSFISYIIQLCLLRLK